MTRPLSLFLCIASLIGACTSKKNDQKLFELLHRMKPASISTTGSTRTTSLTFSLTNIFTTAAG
jgi:hypothetical protein